METTSPPLSESRRSSFANYSSIAEVLRAPQEPRFDEDGWEIVSSSVIDNVISKLAEGLAAAAAEVLESPYSLRLWRDDIVACRDAPG
ncbi:hypothetical protein PINS_up023860 [Pythium insidiosum]|nr:hypothetical protein PINS_up023860 [Pythium insidiosum]